MSNSIYLTQTLIGEDALVTAKAARQDRDTAPEKHQTLFTSLNLMQSLKVSTRLISFSPPGCSNQNRNPYLGFFTSALSEHVESLGCPLILMYYIKMTSIKRPCNFLPSTLFSLPMGVGKVPLWMATDSTLTSFLRYYTSLYLTAASTISYPGREVGRTGPN